MGHHSGGSGNPPRPGQPGQFGGPGVWMVQFQSVLGGFSPFAGTSQVAPPSVWRETNQPRWLSGRTGNSMSDSSGTATSGGSRTRPCRIPPHRTRASKCRVHAEWTIHAGDGLSWRVATDGAGTVYRYTPGDGRVVPVPAGFAFVAGHTNTLTLDGFGNLWIGDDTTDGALNFTGRLSRIPAAALATIP